MVSEFLLKLFNGGGPVDRCGCLVGISDVLIERSFQSIGTEEVIGLQMFALQEAEPDFNLIEPGRIGRQPMHLKVQVLGTAAFLLLEPVFQLLGGVCGSMIKHEDHCMYLTAQGFGNDLLLDEGLEIDTAFPRPTGSVDLAIGDGASGTQMPGATTMRASFMEHWFAWTSRTRRLLTLTCLDGGFLIETDQPRALTPKRLGLARGVQDRAGTLEERDGIMDMLPGMVTPGAKTLGFQPAPHRTGRDGRKGWGLGNMPSQFRPTPARERDVFLLGYTTGDGGDVHALLRGKNASALHCGARRHADGFAPNDHAMCAPCGLSCQRLRPVVDSFVQDGSGQEE